MTPWKNDKNEKVLLANYISGKYCTQAVKKLSYVYYWSSKVSEQHVFKVVFQNDTHAELYKPASASELEKTFKANYWKWYLHLQRRVCGSTEPIFIALLAIYTRPLTSKSTVLEKLLEKSFYKAD